MAGLQDWRPIKLSVCMSSHQGTYWFICPAWGGKIREVPKHLAGHNDVVVLDLLDYKFMKGYIWLHQPSHP